MDEWKEGRKDGWMGGGMAQMSFSLAAADMIALGAGAGVLFSIGLLKDFGFYF